MKTIADAWSTFAAQVMPKGAPQVQHQEMRRAFYAGAHSALCLMGAIADEASSEEAGAALIEALHRELARFVHDIQERRA